MAENKKSFVLYADIIHTARHLSKEDAGELFLHILGYVNDENPVTDNPIVKVSFEPIKQQLKRDLVKWEKQRIQRSEAGKRSADIRAAKSNERSTSFNESQQASTDNVNDNVNVNVTVNNNSNDVDADRQKEYIEAHKLFGKKLWEDSLACQAIWETYRKRVTEDSIKSFNANLYTRSVQHNHYSEWKKHFANWFSKQEKTTSKAIL